jgi:hypothetical protein
MFSSIAPGTASGAKTQSLCHKAARKKLRRNTPEEAKVLLIDGMI